MHGDRRVGVHLQVLEHNAARFVAHTRYDPGLILARHAHKSDALIFILDGEVQIGEGSCRAGTLIVLEKDNFFGPLIAGPEGCTFLESYAGDVASVHEDDELYHQLLSSKGIVPIVP
jgi:anti-sigma factor ChrR (cupin superfamily)